MSYGRLFVKPSPKLALVLLPLLFCSACAKDVVVQRVPVPERLLSCKAEPAPPAEDTDKAVAGYIVALIQSGADCRSKVKAIADWNKAP